MANEIKEMLDNMKEISSFVYTTDWFELNYEDTKILLDYITNLQNEIFDLKDTIQDKDDCINAYECIIEDRDKRIDKAVEYIDSYCLEEDGYVGYGDDLNPKELVNILKGEE